MRLEKEIIHYVEHGVTYVGGSAGAHIATKDISHLVEFDPLPEDMDDFNGLGLFDGILVCHYTPLRQLVLDRLQNISRFPVFALTDEESIVIE